MAHLEGGTAPNTRNRAYEIVAEVERPTEGAEGVLVAFGNHSSGYSSAEPAIFSPLPPGLD
jgi:hypothetical protein